MFASNQDLIDLTGYRWRKRQAAWLADHGYRFEVRADGSLAVMVAEVEFHLLSRRAVARSKTLPDLAALG